MCLSLTNQVRSIATVTTAVARGDLTQKIAIEVEGEMSTLKITVNAMVDQLSAFASEVRFETLLHPVLIVHGFFEFRLLEWHWKSALRVY